MRLRAVILSSSRIAGDERRIGNSAIRAVKPVNRLLSELLKPESFTVFWYPVHSYPAFGRFVPRVRVVLGSKRPVTVRNSAHDKSASGASPPWKGGDSRPSPPIQASLRSLRCTLIPTKECSGEVSSRDCTGCTCTFSFLGLVPSWRWLAASLLASHHLQLSARSTVLEEKYRLLAVKCFVHSNLPCKLEAPYTPLQCLEILSSCSPGESCNAMRKDKSEFLCDLTIFLQT